MSEAHRRRDERGCRQLRRRGAAREAGHDVVGVTLRVAPWEEPDDAAARFGSLLLHRGRERRAPGRAAARHPLLPAEPRARVRPSGHRRLHRASTGRGARRAPASSVTARSSSAPLLRRARAWDAEAVATGHYARVARDPRDRAALLLRRGAIARRTRATSSGRSARRSSRPRAFRSASSRKDEVRAHARAPRPRDAPTSPRARSSASCSGDYRGVPARRAPEAFRPGAIVDERGREVGRARRARRLHGRPAARPRPREPAARLRGRARPERNAVVGGPARGASTRDRPRGRARQPHRVEPPAGAARGRGAIRHRSPRRPPATRARRSRATRSQVVFDTPQRAVTPGPVGRPLPGRRRGRRRRDRAPA